MLHKLDSLMFCDYLITDSLTMPAQEEALFLKHPYFGVI